MIKDRRMDNHFVRIDYFSKETFEQYPVKNFLTLTLVTDGVWEFTLNNIAYRLDAPFIFCLNETDTFTLHKKERSAAKTFIFDTTFINSSLTQEALSANSFENIEDMHDRNLVQSFLLRNSSYNGLLTLNAPSSIHINNWISIMGAECLSQSDGKWTCRIRRHLLQILYMLEDEFVLCYEKKVTQKQPIDYALEYIHSNYHLGLTLDEISKFVGLNRTTLNKHCKQKTGMTIIQYLSNYRTKMAEDALRHTNLNLNEIAICCGYNYEPYFIKTFTEKTGLTPTEYRKLHRKY